MSTPGGPARAGARRGTPAPRARPPRTALLLGLGAVALLAGWLVLVWAAIHWGRVARGGDGSAWPWLVAASAGAAVCLFASLMAGTAALRRLGVLAERAPRRH